MKRWFLIDDFQFVHFAYLTVSQCILANRRPGNVNKEPSKPHHRARKNFNTILDAGPLLETSKKEQRVKVRFADEWICSKHCKISCQNISSIISLLLSFETKYSSTILNLIISQETKILVNKISLICKVTLESVEFYLKKILKFNKKYIKSKK